MTSQPHNPDEAPTAHALPRKLTSHEAKALVIGLLTLVSEIGALLLAAHFKVSGDKYLTFSLLFPFGFIFSLPVGGFDILPAVLMLAQFPVYGFLIGRAWIRQRFRKTLLILGATHAAAAILGFGVFLLR